VTQRRVDAVFFDLYGTLVDLAGLEWACDVAAPGRGAELAARWRQRQIEATWLRNSMDRWADFATLTEEALGVAAAELGIELDPEAVARTLLPAWRILPARLGVEALLDRLDAAGVPSGILTNGSVVMVDATVDGAGLEDRFRWCLSVDAVRRYKPAPEVYGLAVAAAGASPDRIGFVTANAWDAAGAAAFGFRVAWLRTAGVALPAVGPIKRPPAAVTLEEVASLFGA
jgi:2-haloacid dehalogenase